MFKFILTIFVVFAAVVGVYVVIDSGKGYSDYKDKKISDAQHLSRATLQNISKTFIQEKGINERHLDDFYKCLSQGLYDKNDNLYIKDLVALCYEDYQVDHKMDTYYDVEALLVDFSFVDGSYRPIKNLIKKNLADSSSLEIDNTSYILLLNDKRPHMTVITNFRAKNAYGVIIPQKVVADIDAKTKEIYNIY